MKNLKKTRGWLVMAAALTLGLSACSSSSDDSIIEQPTNPTEPKVYTMTVQASKGDGAMTRALSYDSGTKTLNATWTAGDEVTVTKDSGGETLATYGTLTATNVSADGQSCTLTGKLTTAPNVSDVLTLRYNNGGYASQKGTLDYIATHCDIAIATVQVASVENGIITTTGDANFESQQAIVKFSLMQPNGDDFNVTSLNIKHGSYPYKVKLDKAAQDVYVAIPEGSGTILLEATDGTSTYFYKKTGVTFTNGQYYAISVKMKLGTVDLSAATGDITLKNGDIAYGTLAGDFKVSIASNAEVTLRNVTINGVDGYDYSWAGLNCNGDATINLLGTNTVRGFYKNYPGIHVPSDKTLTIQGDGSLNASSNGNGAGIGGGKNIDCGNIRIEGGNITATGGIYSAGIGGGDRASCGNITITGGTVITTGGTYGAGIGSGQGRNGSDYTCGDINISGGTIIATGGERAAGIGSGFYAKCGKITITDKVNRVTAIKGDACIICIGPGQYGTSGRVKIGNKIYDTDGTGPNQGDAYIYEPQTTTQ